MNASGSETKVENKSPIIITNESKELLLSLVGFVDNIVNSRINKSQDLSIDAGLLEKLRTWINSNSQQSIILPPIPVIQQPTPTIQPPLSNIPNKYSYRLKTVVINLKRRPDRLQKFLSKNQSKLTKFNASLFEAVDGKQLSPNNHLLKLFETNDFDWKRGVIGCACSHILVWLDLVKSNEFDTMLVLEDDAELCELFVVSHSGSYNIGLGIIGGTNLGTFTISS